MNEVLKRYRHLLARVDEWFDRCVAACPEEIACRSGCSGCCRGLFDITLLDAFLLRTGFARLPAEQKSKVHLQAYERLEEMREQWPGFDAPYVLNIRAEEEWEDLMPEEDDTPCLLLDESGSCILYDWRPMTCRLNGIPHIDLSGEVLFDEWCSLNFAIRDPLMLEQVRGDFVRLFREELVLFRSFTDILFKQQLNEVDTFIPTALLIDFARFDWHGWLDRTHLVENPVRD